MQPNQLIVTLLSVLSNDAGVAKLVDVPDLGSGAARHGGSSPSARTDNPLNLAWSGGFLIVLVLKLSVARFKQANS